jgi:hypothetical protein
MGAGLANSFPSLADASVPVVIVRMASAAVDGLPSAAAERHR